MRFLVLLLIFYPISGFKRGLSVFQNRYCGYSFHSRILVNAFDENKSTTTTISDYIAERKEWVLSYADLSPYTEKDIIGTLFLSTNLLYFVASTILYFESTAGQSSSLFSSYFSVLLDLAGLFSSAYHYSQLAYGPKDVRVVNILLADYVIAILSIFSFSYDLFINHITFEHPESIALTLASVLCLFSSWAYEYGVPYMLFHGSWHILSALAVINLHSIR